MNNSSSCTAMTFILWYVVAIMLMFSVLKFQRSSLMRIEVMTIFLKGRFWSRFWSGRALDWPPDGLFLAIIGHPEGSTDYMFIPKYLKNDRKIMFFSQDSGGQSSTRPTVRPKWAALRIKIYLLDKLS